MLSPLMCLHLVLISHAPVRYLSCTWPFTQQRFYVACMLLPPVLCLIILISFPIIFALSHLNPILFCWATSIFLISAGLLLRHPQFLSLISVIRFSHSICNSWYLTLPTFTETFLISNHPDLLSIPSIDSHTPSDHYLVTFVLTASVHHPPPSPPLHLLNYSKADLDNMLLYFLDVNLDFCLHIFDVNEIWFYIKREIQSACHRFVPKVKVSKSPSPKWFTAEIRHSIKTCRSLRRRLKLHSTPYLTSKLHELESELGNLIYSSRLEYERDLCSKYHNDPAKLFHYLRELSHPKSSLYPIIHNSQPVVDPHIKASLFNVYFNSVFTTSDFILPPTDGLPSPTDQLSSIVIDASDVFEAISSLNSSKAPGIDDI